MKELLANAKQCVLELYPSIETVQVKMYRFRRLNAELIGVVFAFLKLPVPENLVIVSWMLQTQLHRFQDSMNWQSRGVWTKPDFNEILSDGMSLLLWHKISYKLHLMNSARNLLYLGIFVAPYAFAVPYLNHESSSYNRQGSCCLPRKVDL